MKKIDPDRLWRGQTRLRFRPGQIIYAQGDHADSVYYIESGPVTMTVTAQNGKEAIVGIFGESEFVGLRSLVAKKPRIATATALADCRLVRITPATIMRLIDRNPAFAQHFVEVLIQRLLYTQFALLDQLNSNAEERLARSLLQLLRVNGGAKTKPTPIRINQTLLANMVGTTRPRVSSFMNKFKRLGLIDYDRNGFLTVHHGLARRLSDSELSTDLSMGTFLCKSEQLNT